MYSDKLNCAIAYVRSHMTGGHVDAENEVINDAANIYGDNYDEYLELWGDLSEAFGL